MKFCLLFASFLLLLFATVFPTQQAANLDRFILPEIPAQHIVLKQKQIDPQALQKFKQCVANCALGEMNKYPHDQKPGKQNLAAIQTCADSCNGKQ